MGYQPPMQPVIPTPSALDPQNERLLDLSEQVGQLGSQNDMLNEDNRRLEQENADLRKRNQELQERNTRLESEAAAASAGYKSGAALVDEIEQALKNKKGSK
jgi:regulator of replication initiation timing